MSKNYYLPSKDQDKDLWLKNFANKLPQYATKYGILPADVTEMQKCTIAFTYWLDYRNQIDDYVGKLTAYKNELRDGAKTDNVNSIVPVLPVLPAPPAPVSAGIFGRVAIIVATIKKHSKYTIADGNNLGIEGIENTTDFDNLRPDLKLHLIAGGQPEIIWKRNNMDALEIWVDRDDDAGFVFCSIDTRPNYTDKEALPNKAKQWKYKAIYRLKDERVGQWSKIENINVVAQ